MERICTCSNEKCTLHPNKHNNSCTPCIAKNLKTRELPSCFFNLLKNAYPRQDDSLEEFARLVLRQN